MQQASRTIGTQDARRRQTAEYAATPRRSAERPWYSPQQSPHVSPHGSFASLDRRLLGLAVAASDTAEFPIVPPERILVKATIVWRHSGQVITSTGGIPVLLYLGGYFALRLIRRAPCRRCL